MAPGAYTSSPAGLHRDLHRVGQHERHAQGLGVTTADVDHDILELGDLPAQLNTKGARIAATAYA